MLFFLILLLFSDVTALIEAPVQDPSSFNLKIGEEARMGDLIIGFEEVLSDSRCPKGVSCIWAGEARILLTVYRNDKLKEKVILTIPGSGLGGLELEKYLPETDVVAVTGFLKPYPIIDKKTTSGDYRLKLRFSWKKDAGPD